jgi:competence protein ComEA
MNRVWIYVIVFLLVATLAGGAVLGYRLSHLEPVEIQLTRAPVPTPIGAVYIDGAVSRPGLYPVTNGQSLAGLLSEAGVLPDAKSDAIHIYVPLNGETSGKQRIDLNRAEAWLLEALPGIGELKAKAIIAYRTSKGPFTRPEDLLKVEGISETILEKIRDMITVG